MNDIHLFLKCRVPLGDKSSFYNTCRLCVNMIFLVKDSVVVSRCFRHGFEFRFILLKSKIRWNEYVMNAQSTDAKEGRGLCVNMPVNTSYIRVSPLAAEQLSMSR